MACCPESKLREGGGVSDPELSGKDTCDGAPAVGIRAHAAVGDSEPRHASVGAPGRRDQFRRLTESVVRGKSSVWDSGDLGGGGGDGLVDAARSGPVDTGQRLKDSGRHALDTFSGHSAGDITER